MNKKTFFNVKSISIALICLIMAVCSFVSALISSASAQSEDSIVSANESSIFGSVSGGEYGFNRANIASTMSTMNNSIVLLSDAEENYKYKKDGYTYTIYNYFGEASSDKAAYVNQEIFAIIGTDSTGNYRLSPVNALNVDANINAEGNVTIQIRQVLSITPGLTLWDDSRKLKDLDDTLKIVNNNTTVGKGRVLYRTGTRGTASWSGWNSIAIEDIKETTSGSLSFSTGKKVELVVIYEMKESILYYFHVRGVYRFDIY